MIEIQPGVCCVLTGPSGVGKDEVMKRILKIDDLGFQQVLTTASRKPRVNAGERQGNPYNFIGKDIFEEEIKVGHFLEYYQDKSDGHYKGTPTTAIRPVLLGEKLMWRIDPDTAAYAREKVVEKMPIEAEELITKMVTIYIAPGDWSEIETRYFGRDPNADRDVFSRRFNEDKRIWNEYKGKYDWVVVNANGKLQDTIKFVELILRNV